MSVNSRLLLDMAVEVLNSQVISVSKCSEISEILAEIILILK